MTSRRMCWIAWATVLLYVGVALTLTHMPHPPREVEVVADKYLHATGYFIYAALIYIAGGLTWPRFRWLTLSVVVVLAAWAALDEITQAYFHRDPDIHDWLADMTGVLIAVVLLSTLRFAARRLERPKQSERPLVPSPGTPGEG